MVLISLFCRHTGPIIESNRVRWLKAIEFLTCLLSSPEVSQAFTQKLFITVYLQKLQKHSCFPHCRLPFNWFYPSGLIGQHILFPPRKSSPLELSLLYSLEKMLGYYVWSEVPFQLAIHLGSLKMKQYACAGESSSGFHFYSFHLAQRRKQVG